MTHSETAETSGARAATGLQEPGLRAGPRSPGRRTTRRLLGRILLGATLFVSALAVTGAVYETIASTGDASAFPAPGRLIDIGGYRLHIDCRGKGSPTVVLDAGLGGSSLDWILVQEQLASRTQVCVYDRAGMGWSESGPNRPRTPAQIADELQLVLDGAGIKAPYVLVGHSLGGKTVRMFAVAHPDDVAGMVLLDARSEQMDMHASSEEADGLTGAFKAQAAAYSIARRLGLARVLGASLWSAPGIPDRVALEMALLATQPSAVAETLNEGASRAADDEVLARANLGDLPLVVIAAEQNMVGLAGWAEAQQRLAQLSTNGRLVVAKGSGHYVQLEQPQLVIRAVEQVTAVARADF